MNRTIDTIVKVIALIAWLVMIVGVGLWLAIGATMLPFRCAYTWAKKRAGIKERPIT
jgi:hypothetical protein